MSQFKSRVPGSFWTSSSTIKGADQGYCCSSTGDGTYVPSTRYECFLKNGFFVAGFSEIDAKNQCPKVEKGVCCVYDATTKVRVQQDNGVTFCSCSQSNPTYSGYLVSYQKSGTCPSEKASLAPENGACCYWDAVSDYYVNKCETVANYDSCKLLHDGGPEGLKFSFYLGESCIFDGGNIVCNAGKGLTQLEKENNPDCKTDTPEDCLLEENMLGNCCTLLENGTRQCNISTKSECSGFWSYLGVVKGCSGSTLCSGVYFPEKTATEYFPTTASISVITGSGNPIEKLPTTSALYQGGLYVGIFEPGNTINLSGSMVYGNTTTGDPKQYRARGTGLGTRNKKWILIAGLADTNIPQSSILDPNKGTSFYDGFYNTNIRNTNYYSTIRNTNINGFSDWYIPSQDELAFFFNTITSTFTVSGYTPLLENYYLTSTNYGVGYDNKLAQIGEKYFVYTQSAISSQYGKVILMPQDNLNCKVRLFRRIYLGS